MSNLIQQQPLVSAMLGPDSLPSDDDDDVSLFPDDLETEERGRQVNRANRESLYDPLLTHTVAPPLLYDPNGLGPDDLNDGFEQHAVKGSTSASGNDWRRSGFRRKQNLPPLNEPRRFWQLCVGVLCCFVVSSAYAFNLYSGQLQSKYSFTQSQMTTISAISDVIGTVTIPFSFLYDHYGAWPLFITAMILFPLGGVLLGLTFADVLPGSVPAFAVYACLQSVGTSLLDICAVMTLLSIFPVNRGAVVAVMKTFSGMGSAILGAVHLAFFSEANDNDASRFVFFLAAMGSVVSFLGLIFVEVPPYMIKGCEENVLTEEERILRRRLKRQYLRQKAPLSRFAIGFVIVVVLVIFLPTQGILSAYFDLDHKYHVAFAGISIGLLALYPIMALPLKIFDRKGYLLDVDYASYNSGRVSRVSRASRASRLTRDSMDSAHAMCDIDFIAPQYHTTLFENLRTFRFLALLWTLFCLSGAQLIIIGNMRFLFAALAGEPLEESFMALLVVLVGVGSGAGRILLSLLEIFTQSRSAERRIPITCVLFIPTALTVVSVLLIVSVPPKALPLPCLTMALANGSWAAAVVIVLRTIYAKDVAKHYNCTMLAGIIASVLVNRLLYGEWYTHQAALQGGSLCYGKQCVLVPLLVSLAMNLSAVVSAFYIHWDYSNYCQNMLAARNERLHGGRCHGGRGDNTLAAGVNSADQKGSSGIT